MSTTGSLVEQFPAITRPGGGPPGPARAAAGASAGAELIRACQAGDREAFRELFELSKDRVYTFALRSTGNAAAAEDVTQRVFLKLMQRLGEFRGGSQFTTWLYRIVVNECVDEHRRGRRITGGEEDLARVAAPGDGMEAGILGREVSRAVQAAIASLPPKLRMPLLLRYADELSYEEIAQVMACSAGTVASRLNRGHKLLAEKLEAWKECVR